MISKGSTSQIHKWVCENIIVFIVGEGDIARGRSEFYCHCFLLKKKKTISKKFYTESLKGF